MENSEIKFKITGKDAKSTTEAIKKLIEDELDIETEIISDKENAITDKARGFDPVAVSALILSIPASILAVTDLVDRIKKRKQLNKVLQQTQKMTKEQAIDVKIIYPDSTVKELSKVDCIEIIDSLVKKD